MHRVIRYAVTGLVVLLAGGAAAAAPDVQISDVLANRPGYANREVWVYGVAGQVQPDSPGSTFGRFTLLDISGQELRCHTMIGFPRSGDRLWVLGTVQAVGDVHLAAQQLGRGPLGLDGGDSGRYLIYGGIAGLVLLIGALAYLLLRPEPVEEPAYIQPPVGPPPGFTQQETRDFVPHGGPPPGGSLPQGVTQDFYGRLVVETGDIQGGGKREFDVVNLNNLPGGAMLGRAAECQLQVLNDTVSRRHAQFLLWEGNQVALRNVSDKNKPIRVTTTSGTRTLGQNETTVLASGARIQVGGVVLRFETF